MTNVDKIGFSFYATDEAFVRNLYIGWDRFYRDAFDTIVDEFMSRYNKEGHLIRLDKLELNLGSIPQDDFYLMFPVRLREELERVFLFQSAQIGARESFIEQVSRRLACLKFYLEKGFCPTEWEDAEFDLEKEISFLLPFASAAMTRLFHESIRQPHKLYRLKWNLSNDMFGHLMLFWLEDKTIARKEKEQRYIELRKIDSTLEPSLHKMVESIPLLSERLSDLLLDDDTENSMSWLLDTTISAYEKRRILAALLEWDSIVVIRYIHESQNDKTLHPMAVLLDKIMVRQIINAECADHTEADVPVYWMYLYNWLLKYYPFNGIYMFGNKLQFQEHLNVKLLQFIRKRSFSAFLSKTDITIQFLVEVFGKEYYLEVLNVIYNQQTRNADGSPVYTDYLNMELYYMFLHLSLLKISVPALKRSEDAGTFNGGVNEEAYLYDIQALNTWLADQRISVKERQTYLALLVRERPSILIKILEVQPDNQVLLAELMNQTLVFELLSSVSYYATELFIKLTEYLYSASDEIRWLSGVSTEHLSLFIRIVVLRWLGTSKNRATDSQESISFFIRMLYQEVSSSTYGNLSSVREQEKVIKETIHYVSGQLSLSSGEEVLQDISSNAVIKKVPGNVTVSGEWHEERLIEWLRNPDVSIHVKKSTIRKYIIWQPERVLVLICRLTNQQVIRIEEWLNWLDEDDFIHLIAGISLSKAELLVQIIVLLRWKELVTDDDIRVGIIQFLIEKELGSWLGEKASETIRRFIQLVCHSNRLSEVEEIRQKDHKDDIVPMIMKELLIKDRKDYTMEEKSLIKEPEQLTVSNAGLALLTPWFQRLFSMLGLLNEEKTDFRTMELRIRAIFIIQRLVTYEDREHKESELAFNRILVGCPFSEPLPLKMELTEDELQTIESMLNGVKGNWTKMQNTSIKGFQHNFIERSGRLEQKEEIVGTKWVLTVDSRSYDMLLDSVPWSYNWIKFPWLTSMISVSWRTKQDF